MGRRSHDLHRVRRDCRSLGGVSGLPQALPVRTKAPSRIERLSKALCDVHGARLDLLQWWRGSFAQPPSNALRAASAFRDVKLHGPMLQDEQAQAAWGHEWIHHQKSWPVNSWTGFSSDTSVREVNTDHRIQLQHLVQAALAPGTYQRLSQFCEEDFDETNSRKNQQMAKKKNDPWSQWHQECSQRWQSEDWHSGEWWTGSWEKQCSRHYTSAETYGKTMGLLPSFV